MTARWLPEIALPGYSYVPGRFPHPHSDPAGHRFGAGLPAAELPDPNLWRTSLHYLLGIDLFNHGFYWEAHERWESLWHAAGRRGPQATFFKALIQLAVAGVKAREGRADAVRDHARRAAELLKEIEQRETYGLQLLELEKEANAIAANPPLSTDPHAGVEIVLPILLDPH